MRAVVHNSFWTTDQKVFAENSCFFALGCPWLSWLSWLAIFTDNFFSLGLCLHLKFFEKSCVVGAFPMEYSYTVAQRMQGKCRWTCQIWRAISYASAPARCLASIFPPRQSTPYPVRLAIREIPGDTTWLSPTSRRPAMRGALSLTNVTSCTTADGRGLNG